MQRLAAARQEARVGLRQGKDEGEGFLDLRPVTPGHLLVIPNQHVVFTHDVPGATAERLFAVAWRLARTLRQTDAIRADGVNLFVADGEAAEQVSSTPTSTSLPGFLATDSSSMPRHGANRSRAASSSTLGPPGFAR